MPKAKFSPAYARFRQLLVQARRTAGLKQADVAKRLGRHQSYVSKVEAGERRLDVVEFLEFAAAIKADPVPIVRGVDKIGLDESALYFSRSLTIQIKAKAGLYAINKCWMYLTLPRWRLYLSITLEYKRTSKSVEAKEGTQMMAV